MFSVDDLSDKKTKQYGINNGKFAGLQKHKISKKYQETQKPFG